jgi:type IV secretory pathway VirB10-like protein
MTHVRRSFIAPIVFIAASAVMLIAVPHTQAAKQTSQPKASPRNVNQGQQQQQQPSHQGNTPQQEQENPNEEQRQKPDKDEKEQPQAPEQKPDKITPSNEFGKQRSESARAQHGLSEEQQESIRLKQEELRIRLDAIQDLPLVERLQAMRELRAELKTWAFEQGLHFTPMPSKEVNIARYKSTNLKNVNR